METKGLSSNRIKRRQVELIRSAANSQRIRHRQDIVTDANESPIGKLLRNISVLPEIRQEKVLELRSRIKDGSYNCEELLDVAIDRVLEELLV